MKKFLLLFAMCFAFVHVWAQERTVSGKVTSAEDGTALPGVNVVVQGTSTGAVTDIDGNYSVSVPSQGGTLVFSFIGLASQEVQIGQRSVIDVQMESDVTQLSEVVVTGYGGAQLKRDVTGAIASVKGESIENVPIQSFDRALQGRAAGVQIGASSGQPGGALNVRIRGIGSVNAGNDPLYIVDGVQVNNSGISGQSSSNALGAINPNDIESIEILKDAASAAIYGAQAANGVVIITTKRGKSGQARIRASVQEGVSQPMNLYDMMSSQEWTALKREAYANNPNFDPADAESTFGNPDDPDLVNYNWQDAIFRDSRFSNYDLSLSGGDDKTQFFVSGSYNFQEGIIVMSDWERYTGRLNLTTKASEKLTINANLSLAYQESFGAIENGNFVNGPFIGAFSSQPTSMPVDPETGEYLPYPNNGGGHLFNYNILQGVNEEVRSGRTIQTVSNLKATYQIIPALSFTSFIGLGFDDARDDNQRPQSIPVFAGNGGSALVVDRRFTNMNTYHNFNFNKRFNEVHTVSAIAGFEYKSEKRETFSASATGFPLAEYRLLSSGSPGSVTGTFTQYQRVGVFGKLIYDFDDKYSADLTLRRDGSSRFSPENRFGTFWAAAFGWRISSESFMDGADFIENLKLRVSYGLLGNSEIGNFDYVQAFVNPGVQARYLNANSSRLNRIAGEPITWEESLQANIGLDYSLFGGRIYGAFDVWRNKSQGLLFNKQLPFDSGFGTVRSNVGELQNQGIDIEFGSVNVNSGGFRWSTNFNISFQENELLSLPNGDERIGNTLIVGEPINFLWGAEYAGVNPATGRPMYYDADGNITYFVREEDRRIIGHSLPTYFGGLINNLSYKGLSLEVFFQYQGGNDYFNQDLYNLADVGAAEDNQMRFQLDRWQEPGDISAVPIAYQGGTLPGGSSIYTFSTRLVSDASYIRLKTVRLSYSFPEALISRTFLKGATLFVQGLNLATFTEFSGIDPEVLQETPSTYGSYPNGRQYSAGVTIDL